MSKTKTKLKFLYILGLRQKVIEHESGKIPNFSFEVSILLGVKIAKISYNLLLLSQYIIVSVYSTCVYNFALLFDGVVF